MTPKKSLMENLSYKQKEAIGKLDDETLTRIYQSRDVALEYATKGILQTESEKSPDEIAEYMHVLARIVLEERGVLGKI